MRHRRRPRARRTTSQTAPSRQIKALEDQLGQRLLEHRARFKLLSAPPEPLGVFVDERRKAAATYW